MQRAKIRSLPVQPFAWTADIQTFTLAISVCYARDARFRTQSPVLLPGSSRAGTYSSKAGFSGVRLTQSSLSP
jgi:hypothetical protein